MQMGQYICFENFQAGAATILDEETIAIDSLRLDALASQQSQPLAAATAEIQNAVCDFRFRSTGR